MREPLSAQLHRSRLKHIARVRDEVEQLFAAELEQAVKDDDVEAAARATADVFTCLRLHTTLDAAGRHLEANAERHLKSALTMQTLFRDLPAAVENSAHLEQRLAFTLQNLGYYFPTYPTPDGRPMSAFLHEVTFACARTRFGTVPAALAVQLERELALIAKLGFSGYFLIVWDICRWAREERGMLVQGLGADRRIESALEPVSLAGSRATALALVFSESDEAFLAKS